MKSSRALAATTGAAALALLMAVAPATGPASASTSVPRTSATGPASTTSTSTTSTSTTSTSTTSTSATSGGTLHIVMPWTSVPDNFNPLNPGGTASTAGGTGSAIYEPLMYVNPYDGHITDMLGTSFTWSGQNTVLTITTRQGVTWNDGTPFSAADVAFTFDLLKRYPVLDVDGLFKDEHLVSVTATSPTTVVFKFSSAYTTDFDQIVSQSIVPEHIWANVADPVTFTNTKDPVGTGPFELKSYQHDEVTYKKNPNYWMPGRPYISGLVMTAARSVTGAELAMLQGDDAETYAAFVDPQRSFVALHPTWDQYWWPVVNLNLLYFNNTKAPFDAVTVRKAVAEAINTTIVSDRAYFGAIPPANEAALATGQLGQWLSTSARSLQWAQDPAKALTLLEAHGYKLVDGRLNTPAGSVLPTFKILIGTGWTDFLSIAETISQELSAIGLSTSIDQEPYTTYQHDLASGSFTMALSWTTDGDGSPYSIYSQLLGRPPTPGASSLSETSTEAGSPATLGGALASGDWERYTSPSVSAALAQFNAKTGALVRQSAISTIEKDLLDDVPVVPLTGRPNFLDYSTRYFTGWPSAANPYDAGESPDAFGGGAEQVFLNIHES